MLKIKLIYHIFAEVAVNVSNTIIWFLKQIIKENFRNYIRKNRCGRRIAILSNGPSLKYDSMDVFINIQEVDVCVMNDFCKSPIYKQLKPIVYVLADPLYFEDKIMRKSEAETIAMLLETDWYMELYVPYSYIKKASLKISNQYIKIVPYHTNSYTGWSSIEFFLYKRGLSMPLAQNVLIPCIFNSINLGYSEIKLYGVDHSWTQEIRVDGLNRVCLTDSHFYDSQKAIFSPWLKCSGEQYKMHEILKDLSSMFEGYHSLRNYADKSLCKILNMTRDSFIDAFERK